MQQLSIFDEEGKADSKKTDAKDMWEFSRQIEANSLPLDLAAFNRYHHGGKVQAQDHKAGREVLARGEAGGLDMPNLRKLVEAFPSA